MERVEHDRHRDESVTIGRGARRTAAVRVAVVRRSRGAYGVKPDDHPQTTDLVDASRTLRVKELVAAAGPHVVVAVRCCRRLRRNRRAEAKRPFL